MTFPKFIAVFALVLFGFIAAAALLKAPKESHREEVLPLTTDPLDIELETQEESAVASDTSLVPVATVSRSNKDAVPAASFGADDIKTGGAGAYVLQPADPSSELDLPEGNRINQLFNVNDPKLPIVETITYKSRTAWQKGRPAWLSDYASHYRTSRHFIARSLNGKADYLKQDIAEGNRFNVLHDNISFYLVADLSRCKLWLYSFNQDANERMLLKTYKITLGRLDSTKSSGSLTPLGRYQLGNKVATYKVGTIDTHKGQKIEMVQVFGTRWIPFEKEIADNTAPAKGFGLHGTPLIAAKDGNSHVEDKSSIGKYESDGCVRLSTEDIEELYAIVVSRPTTIELVSDFRKAHLPGHEKE